MHRGNENRRGPDGPVSGRGGGGRQNYQQQQQQQRRPRQQKFADYISREAVSLGLKTGEIITGQLRISKNNFEEAFVKHPSGDADVLIGSRIDQNRALNDDEVAVRIGHVGSWRVHGFYNGSSADVGASATDQFSREPSTVASVLSSGQASFSDLFPGASADQSAVTRLLQSSADPCQPLPVDRVVRVGHVAAIVRHLASRRFVGRVKPRDGQATMEVFEPLDSRQPRCNVSRAELEKFSLGSGSIDRTILIAEVAEWAPSFFMPRARICSRLGERPARGIDLELETCIILTQLGIESDDYGPDASSKVAVGINAEELQGRWDFRDPSSYCVFTVDKEMAQDLDDAVHYRDLEGGGCEVGVHIADVSHYVRPGSQVDARASARGASTYLAQRWCNMLPQRLSEGVCSLLPHRDRLAFSVVWTMDPRTGEVKSTRFGKSVIRSCCQLSYPEVQRFIEDRSDSTDEQLNMPEAPHTLQSVAECVRALNSLTEKRRQLRLAKGSLNIDQAKLKFHLSDIPNAPPIGFELIESDDSTNMIEELMLMANSSVAQKLRDSVPQLAFLRQQLPPTVRSLDLLQKSTSALGVQLDVSSTRSIQCSMDQAFKQLEPDIQKYVEKLVVTSMQRAQNFCIGESGVAKQPNLWRHYSLDMPVYASFTSPIRRYADIVVHRQLAAVLCVDAGIELDASAKSFETVQSLSELAVLCNKKEKDASEAGRRSFDLYLAAFYQTVKKPMTETGRVVRLLDKSMDVFLPSCGLENRIFLEYQEDLRGFKLESADQGLNQMKLHFKGCDSDGHWLTVALKSKLDIDVTGCQIKDGRPLRLTLRLKPPDCALCSKTG